MTTQTSAICCLYARQTMLHHSAWASANAIARGFRDPCTPSRHRRTTGLALLRTGFKSLHTSVTTRLPRKGLGRNVYSQGRELSTLSTQADGGSPRLPEQTIQRVFVFILVPGSFPLCSPLKGEQSELHVRVPASLDSAGEQA